MAKTKMLDDLFYDGLKDTYFAEKKILAALPKMAKAAQNQELASAFEKHQVETEEHVNRLEQVFDLIEKKAQGKTCPAILGLIEEGEEIMKEYKGSPAHDLPLNFHPAALRASVCFAPSGAGIATGDRRSWSGLRS